MTDRNEPIIPIDMSHLQSFIDQVEAFLERSAMTPTAFGKAALSDPNFVFDLRNGRVPNLTVVDRVERFIDGADDQPISKELVNAEAV